MIISDFLVMIIDICFLVYIVIHTTIRIYYSIVNNSTILNPIINHLLHQPFGAVVNHPR
jgi:hypothetical protein